MCVRTRFYAFLFYLSQVILTLGTSFQEGVVGEEIGRLRTNRSKANSENIDKNVDLEPNRGLIGRSDQGGKLGHGSERC